MTDAVFNALVRIELDVLLLQKRRKKAKKAIRKAKLAIKSIDGQPDALEEDHTALIQSDHVVFLEKCN